MTLIQFNKLSERAKVLVLSRDGEIVTMWEDNENNYIVYKLFGFMVELRFLKDSIEYPTVRTFNSNIPLNDILENKN